MKRESELRELIEEWRKLAGCHPVENGSPREAYDRCADELEEVLDDE